METIRNDKGTPPRENVPEARPQNEGPEGTVQAQGKKDAPEPMSYETKFRKLRAAILDLLEMQDDKAEMIAFLDSLIREKADTKEERATRDASIRLMVALMETHESPVTVVGVRP